MSRSKQVNSSTDESTMHSPAPHISSCEEKRISKPFMRIEKSISYKEQVIGHTMTVLQLRFNAVWTWKLFLLNHARRNISISMRRYRNVDIWIRASSMPPSLHDKWYLPDISELLFSCLNKLIWWRRLGWMVGRKPRGPGEGLQSIAQFDSFSHN